MEGVYQYLLLRMDENRIIARNIEESNIRTKSPWPSSPRTPKTPKL